MVALALRAALVQSCAPVFTRPSHGIFTDLMAGWVLAPGRRTITAIVSVADPGGRREEIGEELCAVDLVVVGCVVALRRHRMNVIP